MVWCEADLFILVGREFPHDVWGVSDCLVG